MIKMATRSLLCTLYERLTDQQKAEAGNDNSPASSRTFDDSQESSEETDTSIPAIAPQATNKAKLTPRLEKRKRMPGIFDGDDEEPEFSQNENEDDQDDTSDVSFPGSQESPSGRALKASKRPSTQESGRNNVSSALPTKTKNHSRRKEVDHVFETQNRATSSSRKTDSQAEGGDEDEDEEIGSGPGRSGLPIFALSARMHLPYRRAAANNLGPSASQAPRRNEVRPGRPEPGQYRMNAKAWPV